jgi:hypothetical protein
MNLRIILIIAAIMLGSSSTMLAQEKTITRRQLPPPVEQTVARESQGATIKSIATETDHGKRLYELALIVEGHTKDISIDKNGNIIEIEEEVAMDSLPAAVQDGLRSAAGAGVIGRIESLTKHGKLVAFEAQIKNRNKRAEIQVGPNGEKLARRQ